MEMACTDMECNWLYIVIIVRCIRTEKDIEGIWFEGFIPTVLSEIRIFNLRYVNMRLDVSSKGEGKIVKMTLDGVEARKIFWNLQGHHKVKLICRKED